MLRIDSHQHFWRYHPEAYGWINDTMSALQRDFLPDDLKPALDAQGMDGCIAVQARQTTEETDWLLKLAAGAEWIRGVVGWVPLASPQAAALIGKYADTAKLKGFRHVVQAEPPGFLLESAFHRGVNLLAQTGLTYDLLISAAQLLEASQFADMHPMQRIVLDHVAKPHIRDGALEPWRTHIRELARRQHVYCKLSGLVTEADWQHWSLDTLRPYLDVALETFGPDRLMAGSDWPVCTVAASYSTWWSTLETWAADLSSAERSNIFGSVAARVYQLE